MPELQKGEKIDETSFQIPFSLSNHEFDYAR